MILAKIGWKLTMAVALLAALTIGIFSYLVIRAHERELIRLVKQESNQVSETVKSSTNEDMLSNHRERIYRTIDSISHQEGIDRVRIYNKDGLISYSSQRAEMGQLVDKRAEACDACHAADRPLTRLPIAERARIFDTPHGRTLGIINPIYNKPSCWEAACHAHPRERSVLGVLDIAMSLNRVDQQISRSRWNMAAFAIGVVVLLGVVLLLLVRRLIGNPVSRLTAATESVAAGDLNYRIDVASRDELGELAKSFNRMTERLAEMHRQLYQQDKLASLGRLAAGTAHELNNPLTGVLAYSSHLLTHAADEANKADLEVIVRETNRCREIVKKLLNFSRQSPAHKVSTDIDEVIRSAMAIVRHQIAACGAEVQLRLTEHMPRVTVDPGQIEQVLVNLLVNACDAMEGGGTLTVTTALEDGGLGQMLRISVADTGTGIPPQAQGKIFEPFFTTKGQKGTGLGLSVAWGILEEHGGSIRFRSCPGEGTTFDVLLPAAPAAPAGSPT